MKYGLATVHRAVDHVGVGVTVQKVRDSVERIVGRIPAGERQPFLERAFVRDPITAAQRHLAIPECVPGKTYPRAKIIVISSPQVSCGRKPSRPALTCKSGPWIAGAGFTRVF